MANTGLPGKPFDHPKAWFSHAAHFSINGDLKSSLLTSFLDGIEQLIKKESSLFFMGHLPLEYLFKAKQNFFAGEGFPQDARVHPSMLSKCCCRSATAHPWRERLAAD
jgi:hypothetical protein